MNTNKWKKIITIKIMEPEHDIFILRTLTEGELNYILNNIKFDVIISRLPDSEQNKNKYNETLQVKYLNHP